MKKLFYVILIWPVLFAGAANGVDVCATEQCENAQKIPNLPSDVKKFTDQRDGCDHFRGEPVYIEGSELAKLSNKERKEYQDRTKFVYKNIKELCKGTDAQLRALKSRYASHPIIMKLLNSYEEQVESADR